MCKLARTFNEDLRSVFENGNSSVSYAPTANARQANGWTGAEFIQDQRIRAAHKPA